MGDGFFSSSATRPLGAATADAQAASSGDVLLVSVDDASPPPTKALHSGDADERELLGLFSQSADDGGDSEDDDDSAELLAVLTGVERASSPCASPTARAAEPPKRRIKKRRYHEVMRLRETAAALEREFTSLKSRQDSAERSIKNEDGDPDTLRWQKTARREVQATARTRLENTRLRQTLEAQVVFSKSFRQALAAKHRSIEGLQRYFLCDKGKLVIVQPRTPRENDIFDALLRNLFARHCESGEFLSFNGLPAVNHLVTTHKEATVSEARILLNDEQALCIDLVERYVIPFDFRAGARVLWADVVSKHLKMTDQATHTEIIASTEDMIMTKLSTNSNSIIADHQFTTEYSVSKRISYANSVDFLWENVTESKGALLLAPQGTPAIQLVQKGWGKIARLKTSSGTSAASLESYIRLTPSTVGLMSDHAREEEGLSQQQIRLDNRQFDLDSVSSHILTAFREHAASIRRYLENSLIDEMLRSSKAAQRC